MNVYMQIFVFIIGLAIGSVSTVFFVAEDVDTICGKFWKDESDYFDSAVGDELVQGNLTFVFDADESDYMQDHLNYLDNRDWNYSTEFSRGQYYVNASCSTEKGL